MSITSKDFNGISPFTVHVHYIEPLNGNSGQTRVTIEPGNSHIWGGPEEDAPFDPTPVHLNLVGEHEHTDVADALRWAADQLERAPHRAH
ncbi:hypothetical protein [Arenivirga flava]|uniref:Uncharacterized protein n=1 Tax=Arenivirga flava TaxID=1930060 RepID=A0AA37XA60_9MICO|nr:hypothetical protein [Arenivirga flava]GMA27061.1 hypothetical protein GCM10025874_03140 [Arenivirga flava]